MDAVKYVKEKARMCDEYKDCNACPASEKNNKFNAGCGTLEGEFTEVFVAIVEKWSAENPVKTRQSEFLKMFPNAKLNTDGILNVAPCLLDGRKCYIENGCISCRREYWLAEVE